MKMKNKIKLLCIVLCASLLMSGCTLARPQKEGIEPDEKGFIGLYLVYSDQQRPVDFQENKYLTKRNGKYVLLAKEDGTFPGLNGIPLYHRIVNGGTDDAYQVTENGMSDGNAALNFSDTGNTIELSGTLYLESGETGLVAEHWTVFSVYQAEDGDVYLNGNSENVSFQFLTNISSTVTETVTTPDGKTMTNTVTATVFVEERSQLKTLTVRQFSADETLVASTDISLSEESPSILWHPGAAWAIAEEVSNDGVKRTAYTRPETDPDPDAEQVIHKFVFFDERGIGQPRELTFR